MAENGKVEFYVNVSRKDRATDKVIKILGSGLGMYLVGNAVAWAVSDNPKEETWGGSMASYWNYVAGNTAKAAEVVMDVAQKVDVRKRVEDLVLDKIPRWAAFLGKGQFFGDSGGGQFLGE